MWGFLQSYGMWVGGGCGVVVAQWEGGKGGAVKIDYRPVHEYTLTDDVEYIKPKKRVY